MNTTINETMLWFFIPEENMTIKQIIDIAPYNETIINYSFTINNSGLHIPTAYLSSFDEIYPKYIHLSQWRWRTKRAVLTLDYDELYDPGEIKINTTVENVEI